MAEVIRWSTAEDMMNTTLERETQGSLSRCLAQLSSLRIHVLVHSAALIFTRMDGPEWDSTKGVVLKQDTIPLRMEHILELLATDKTYNVMYVIGRTLMCLLFDLFVTL